MKKKTLISIQHIKTRKTQNIKKPKRKPNTWLFPQSQEREYTRDLLSLTKDLARLITDYLIPEIPGMYYEVNIKTPNDRNDDFLDRLNSWILFIRNAIDPKIEETIFQSKLIAREINRFNYGQFQKVNQSVLGINLFVDEPWLEDQLKLFASQNSELIVSLPDQELERVSGIIERGLQTGSSIKDIEKEIKNSFGITARRAKLIARDQTTKLNASLTKLRQQEVGVEEYVWQTSGDERVRPTHRENDGKTFRWDKPPAKTGHPGSDVNCRCVALPVLNNLLDID